MSDKKLETLIFAQQIHDEDFRKKVLPRTKKEYYQFEECRIVNDLIQSYFDKYSTTPTYEAIEIDLQNKQNLTEEHFKLASQLQSDLFSDKYKEAVEKVNIGWLVERTEKYYKDRQIYNAIMQSIDIIDGTDKKLTPDAIPELLEKALGTTFDDGDFHDYFESAEMRYDYFHQPLARIPFKLKMLNYITKNGMLRKTLNIFVGPTGAGKTMFLCDESAYWLMQGYNVLYVTLEMSAESISQRIDANLMDLDLDDLTGLPKKQFVGKIQQMKKETVGRLFVKEYPPGYLKHSELSMFIADLKRKHGFVPDIVVLDYINLAASSRVRADADSYTSVKKTAEEYRGCAIKNNFCLVTATQTNRSGQKNSDFDLTEISESHGLAMTADFMIGGIVSDEMEDLRQMRLKQLKNRYGAMLPSSFLIGIDRPKMKMIDLDIPTKQLDQQLREEQKQLGGKQTEQKPSRSLVM